MKDPRRLYPHPQNDRIYGKPQDNEQFDQMVKMMKKGGYNTDYPLTVTSDNRVLAGCTRHAAALAAKVKEVPCLLFTPTDPETAENEYQEELLRDNQYRAKTRYMVAREWQLLMDVEKELARQRMAKGKADDEGPSKASVRVGIRFKVGGKTVERYLKVLDAIDLATEEGDKATADKLTRMLNAGRANQALEQIKTGLKPGKGKPVKVDAPRTIHDHASMAFSEFYEACAKAGIEEELRVLEQHLDKMHKALQTARGRLKCP